MKELVGLPFQEIQKIVAEIGEKPFRAKQLWQWVYNKGVVDLTK